MKRWLVRGGVALGVLVLLIVAFYVEENWRGARLWAATKAEYEAKGFSFDSKSLIPPPIPDEENFAASPIWKHLIAASDSKNAGRPKSALLEMKKKLGDWAKQNKQITLWKLGQKLTPTSASLFDSAQIEIAQLYTASSRPACRFDTDYNYPLPAYAPLPHVDACHLIIYALSRHALAALDQKRPDIAYQDILTCWKLSSGCYAEPITISGIVAQVSLENTLPPLWSGLNSHQWSDEQLADFQKQLGTFDLLKCYVTSFKGEFLNFFIKTVDWFKEHRLETRTRLYQLGFGPPERFYSRFATGIGPSGWFDDLKSAGTHLYLEEVLPSVEPENHRIIWAKHHCDWDMAYLFSYHPTFFLISYLTPASDWTIHKFAEAQSYLDMAQVACGLERYWLVNKKYPATLAELEPKFIAKVPHDLCNGEPLHYRVEADGNYALYSVGFNGTDDGGKVVMLKYSETTIDLKQGDWVWPRQGFSQSSPRR